MTDRRLHPGNGRVVLAGFAAEGDEQPIAGVTAGLSRDAWLLGPDGRRVRQLLFGDEVSEIARDGDLALIRAAKDGYVGWVDAASLGRAVEPTHHVAVRTTWAYPEPDLKSPAILPLHMTARTMVEDQSGNWVRISGGRPLWVHSAHLRPLGRWLDVVDAARAFLGTHYLWAGNTGFGLDCSGLVQAAFRAAGRDCAADSDLQEAMPGRRLAKDEPPEPGDLVFWLGHVALVTGKDRIIHANAHHMMVVEEPLSDAVARIASAGIGEVTSVLRPD